MRIIEIRHTSQSFLQWLGREMSMSGEWVDQLGDLMFTSAWITIQLPDGCQLSFCRYREVDL